MVYIFICGFLRNFASFCFLRAPGSVGVDRFGVDAFSGFLVKLKDGEHEELRQQCHRNRRRR